MSEFEKLEYLSAYFPYSDYQVFLQVVKTWIDQGGDIICLSRYLLDEIRNNEDYLSKSEALSKRKYYEIGVLWALCLAILLLVRFCLKDFYLKLKGQLVFIISIAVLMAFVLFSIVLVIRKGSKAVLRRYLKNEKVI